MLNHFDPSDPATATRETWTVGGAVFAVGAIARPIDADEACGDATVCWEQEQRLYLALADGLGHGEFARVAALAALASVQQHPPAPLPTVFAQCDQDIRETRGVALGIAIIDPVAQTATFCGVGNIRVLLLGERPRHFSCSYGIVGAGFKNLIVETMPFAPGDLLILASDGIMEQFMAPELHPDQLWSASGLAEAILAEWSIATDDASVLVCQALPR